MKFSKKTAHRLIIALSMFAPVVYLFGTMFFYLAGAHNGLEIAQPVYAEVVTYVEVDSFVEGESYRLEISDVDFPSAFPSQSTYNWEFTYDSQSYAGFRNGSSGRSLILFDSGGNETDLIQVGTPVLPLPYYFYFEDIPPFSVPSEYSTLTLRSIIQVPTDVVPENNGANSDYLFGQMFPRDNFLVRVGANALSANPVGFAPFGSFLSYLDVNVFHAANSQIALMLYGMVYWSLHVIIADLVYHVAVFVPNIIQRVFDWFGQKGLDDD